MVLPTGAIVAALFSMVCGIVFISEVLEPNATSTMKPMFDIAAWLVLILCPAITMRLVAEERRAGTWELLLASPVSSFCIVKGKFFSAWFSFLMVLATTLPLVFVLSLYSIVDYGAVASGYMGLLMLGAAVLCTGLVVSSLTSSQTVAYLVTTFLWLTISLATKVLPAYLPTQYADIIFAIDPDLRSGEFAIGLIDTANIVYFVTITLTMGWIMIVTIDRTRHMRVSAWHMLLCGVLLLVSIISINNFSMHEQVRIRFDATGSRSYTLSAQTQQLLNEIKQPWKIVILLDDTNTDASVLKQVDEVLRRYQDASPHLSVQRINPADPNAMTSYDLLLRDLIDLYSDELTTAEGAIENGIHAFNSLMTFAGRASAWAESLSMVISTDKETETLQTLASALVLLANEGGLILREVEKSMRVDLSQPLPRIDRARDILVAATGQWSRELYEVTMWLKQDRSDSIASQCEDEIAAFEHIAIELAGADDALRRLGSMELGQLSSQLAIGEGAVILSPDRAMMIPSTLIFPQSVGDSQTVAMDQRFRGEHIISSAMRSLLTTLQPTVVFVHGKKGRCSIAPKTILTFGLQPAC